MYNDTIKAENKIITNNDLQEIFQLMGETLKKYQKTYEYEMRQNQMLELMYQNYTFKDAGSKMKVTVSFYDNTTITFDNYDNFMSIFYSRLDEIKNMDVYYTLNYSTKTTEPVRTNKSYYQSIHMYITENKIEITVKLDSEDPKLDDVYNLIKNKIINAPEKYDEIIKNKSKITNTVAFAIGLIPSIIIVSLLLFIPTLNKIILKGFVIYPIAAVILAFIVGNLVASSKLDKYYKNIVPEKKYAGYSDGKAQYEDDMDKFLGTSEILIGKKVNNLEDRKEIRNQYEKYKKLLPKELLGLLVISVIITIIGLFIK